jgi:hypothetical protein
VQAGGASVRSSRRPDCEADAPMRVRQLWVAGRKAWELVERASAATRTKRNDGQGRTRESGPVTSAPQMRSSDALPGDGVVVSVVVHLPTRSGR